RRDLLRVQRGVRREELAAHAVHHLTKHRRNLHRTGQGQRKVHRLGLATQQISKPPHTRTHGSHAYADADARTLSVPANCMALVSSAGTAPMSSPSGSGLKRREISSSMRSTSVSSDACARRSTDTMSSTNDTLFMCAS